MSKIEVNAIEPQCGTNLTVGASGDTITFPTGTTVVNNGTQTGFGRTGTVDWDITAKTASFTAVSGNGYFINTTSGVVTMTLPASPSPGDIVSVKDYAYTFATNNLIVNRNSSPIGGGTDFNTINYNTDGNFLTFIYVDATEGWLITDDSTNTTEATDTYITATGGCSVSTVCTNYKVHIFNSPGTFEITAGQGPVAKVDYLIIAGGGSGNTGTYAGAGGGAGGFRESKCSTTSGCWTASPLASSTSLGPFSLGSIPVTVGGGGATSSIANSPSAGSNSSFSTITSAGGGKGGFPCASPCGSTQTNANGGSGGGASGYYTVNGGVGNTPTVSPPQGNDGGDVPGYAGVTTKGGGGGGAGAAGSNASPSNTGPGGAGGNGVASSITSSPVTRAGGGAGSADNPGASGQSGGSGGGGPAGGGGSPGNGSSGTANTGSGGGGAMSGGGNTGGSGGSGIVIIRYKFQ